MHKNPLWIVVLILILAGLVWYVFGIHDSSAPSANTSTGTPPGFAEYTDTRYGFSFWYPNDWQVSTTSENDSNAFPGGTLVERLQVGSTGGVMISVVESAGGTITDEPNGHASPIPQTKYFIDPSTGGWMVAYPEGSATGETGATTTADTSNTTIGGLSMLPAGARFDTSIIPLDSSLFLVVQDGGGAIATPLAKTIIPFGAPVDQGELNDAVAAESAAYSSNASQ